MKLDLPNLHRHIDANTLTQRDWGTGCGACFMSAVIPGAKSVDDCAAAGWPKWLAKANVHLFDSCPSEEASRFAEELGDATQAAIDRGADFDAVFRAFRLDSVLPIALDAVGQGEEPWRVKCREAVQWSIDNGGAANPDAADPDAALAALAAGATLAALAALAAGATLAADAAGAADAALALASWASWASWAAANARMRESLVKCLRG